jgi:hypothetical protein
MPAPEKVTQEGDVSNLFDSYDDVADENVAAPAEEEESVEAAAEESVAQEEPAESDPQALADEANPQDAGTAAETTESPETAAGTTAPSPEWIQPILQMQQQTAQMFQQMQQQQMAIQNQMLQSKQQADQQMYQLFQAQQQKQAAKDRAAHLEATKPRHPGHDASQEQIDQYVHAIAQYNADLKFESLQSQMGGQMKGLQSEVERMKAAYAAERQALEKQQADAYVATTLDTLARTPGLEFMRNAEAQELLLDRWYAASSRGEKVDVNQLAAGLGRFFRSPAPKNAIEAQKQLSRDKRASQNSLGAPRTVRAGGSMVKGKSPADFAKETIRDFISNDFEVEVG